jgi:hypothetical protein
MQSDLAVFTVSDHPFCELNSNTEQERIRTMNRINYTNVDFAQLSATQLDQIHQDAKARALVLRKEAMNQMWDSIEGWIQQIITRLSCFARRNAC